MLIQWSHKNVIYMRPVALLTLLELDAWKKSRGYKMHVLNVRNSLVCISMGMFIRKRDFFLADLRNTFSFNCYAFNLLTEGLKHIMRQHGVVPISRSMAWWSQVQKPWLKRVAAYKNKALCLVCQSEISLYPHIATCGGLLFGVGVVLLRSYFGHIFDCD